MMASKRSALGIAVLLLSAAPGAADTTQAGPRHGPARRIVVHPRVVRPAAAPLGAAVAPGVVFETPFTVVTGSPDRIVRVPHYIGPDGTYDEYADLVRSINGTPCGQECARRSLQRWGYAPVD